MTIPLVAQSASLASLYSEKISLDLEEDLNNLLKQHMLNS